MKKLQNILGKLKHIILMFVFIYDNYRRRFCIMGSCRRQFAIIYVSSKYLHLVCFRRTFNKPRLTIDTYRKAEIVLSVNDDKDWKYMHRLYLCKGDRILDTIWLYRHDVIPEDIKRVLHSDKNKYIYVKYSQLCSLFYLIVFIIAVVILHPK